LPRRATESMTSSSRRPASDTDHGSIATSSGLSDDSHSVGEQLARYLSSGALTAPDRRRSPALDFVPAAPAAVESGTNVARRAARNDLVTPVRSCPASMSGTVDRPGHDGLRADHVPEDRKPSFEEVSGPGSGGASLGLAQGRVHMVRSCCKLVYYARPHEISV
jgi:hypothetical protein